MPSFMDINQHKTDFWNVSNQFASGDEAAIGGLRKHGFGRLANATQAGLDYQSLMDKLSSRYEELSDPNSEYYQQFSQNLKKVLSSAAPTTNSLLGLARSQGLGVGSSATIANQQRKATEGRIADYATKATTSAYLQGSGQANQVLQSALSGNLSYQQLLEQMRQFNESQPGVMDYIGAAIPTGLTFGLDKLFPNKTGGD